MIPFNKSTLTSSSLKNVKEAMNSTFHVGDGPFTELCQNFFKEKYGFKHTLLTTSCTHALEMCAILLNFKKGEEIIMPSYTFVSCANSFVREGANVVFCDSDDSSPNLNLDHLEHLITSKTKAILAVHYGGASCDMERLKKITSKHNLILIEDAAQAINSYYNKQPLGSFGDLSTFSFHGTKNISCGEGGALIINNEALINPAEIIREKGTDRSSFLRGEVDKYGWKKLGSSYLLSDILAAKLVSQFEDLEYITEKRKTFSQVTVFTRPEGDNNFIVTADYDWLDSDYSSPNDYTIESTGGYAEYRDTETNYNTAGFVYGGATKPVIRQAVQGSGHAIQFKFVTVASANPYTIHGFAVQFGEAGVR